jgi:plastocyanin
VRDAKKRILLSAVLLGVTAFAQRPQAPSPNEGFPLGPPARVTRFTAEPASIQPGQSVTLTWAAVNADNITIDQGVGILPTRGSRTIKPTATTTYTLHVRGRGGADEKSVIVTVAGTAPTASSIAAPTASKTFARMSDGKPDLSGVYIGGFAVRPQGTVTLKPGAESFKFVPKEGDLGQGALCLPPGVPAATTMPYPMQIIQKPNVVVILYEAYHLFRVIPVGKPHPDDLDPTWMGNSVAHWDGDTLVVDVTGFNDKTVVGGFRHTELLHVVERYQRAADGGLAYEATVEDPNVFAAPWKYAGPLVAHPEWDIQEYVCEENNKNYKELFNVK